MNSIDLHGVKHEDVGKLLDSFFWENMQKNVKGVTIITGNSTEMKRIVNEIIQEYGFTAVEGIFNTGSISVNLI
jgi:DNA-nicking Smr family endonuclease